MYNGQRGEMYALRILKDMFEFLINHSISFEISVLEAKRGRGGGGGSGTVLLSIIRLFN